MFQIRNNNNKQIMIFAGLVAMAVSIEFAYAVITVQIGGATRLSSLSRNRDRYNCYWDCDLVGCQIARDDDECAYDCEKICRIRYDYVGRSGQSGAAGAASGSSAQLAGATGRGDEQLGPKSGAPEPVAAVEGEQLPAELLGAGQSVRLHLPRNASARNFAIWERCSADSETGKLNEKPFNL